MSKHYDNAEDTENTMSDTEPEHRYQRLQKAYVAERKRSQITDIELNRTKVIVMTQDGKRLRIPELAEH
jgi:hypothetical protein